MSGSQDTTKPTAKDDTGATKEQPQKPAAKLEEDDEFEDFPAEGTNTTQIGFLLPGKLRLKLLL
jgi:hypothetical protein